VYTDRLPDRKLSLTQPVRGQSCGRRSIGARKGALVAFCAFVALSGYIPSIALKDAAEMKKFELFAARRVDITNEAR
jgi:hypothetical protein